MTEPTKLPLEKYPYAASMYDFGDGFSPKNGYVKSPIFHIVYRHIVHRHLIHLHLARPH